MIGSLITWMYRRRPLFGMLFIVAALLPPLTIQGKNLVVVSRFGIGAAKPVLREKENLAVIEIDQDWRAATRPAFGGGSSMSFRETRPKFTRSSVEIDPKAVVVAPPRSAIAEMRGLYLAVIEKPMGNGRLGSFRAAANDVAISFAVRLESDKFEIHPSEPATVTFYRALSTTWPKLSLADLRDALAAMPSLEASAPDVARSILKAAAPLEPVRRLLVLSSVKSAHFRMAEKPFEEALWAARDDRRLDQVELTDSIMEDGLRGPNDVYFTPEQLLAKAEKCSSDTARAIYVRSCLNSNFEPLHMAALLRKSGRRSAYEIVRQLGIKSRDPALYIHQIPKEQVYVALDRLVAYWKKQYKID